VLRARRKELKLTLGDLAATSGLSVPFLSQIENGRANPSMQSLQDLAAALGTTAVDLVAAADETPGAHLVKADDNARDEGEAGSVRALVRGHRQLHALEFTGTTDRAAREFAHPNDEILYVVAGRAEVRAGTEVHDLTSGDTLYLPAGTKHAWTALTPATRVLLVGVNDHARVVLRDPDR